MEGMMQTEQFNGIKTIRWGYRIGEVWNAVAQHGTSLIDPNITRLNIMMDDSRMALRAASIEGCRKYETSNHTI
jgi:hypothetical protein